MLGVIGNDPVYHLVEALAAGDGEALLQRVAEMAELTVDFSTALQDLLGLLHQVALLQLVPEIRPDEVYDEGRLQPLVSQLAAEDVQLFYQIGLTGQQELPLAPDPRSGFEMVLLRMLAFRPAEQAAVGQAGNAGPARRGPVRAKPTTEKKTAETHNVRSSGPPASSRDWGGPQ